MVPEVVEGQIQNAVLQALPVHVGASHALVTLNVRVCIHSACDLHQDGALRVYAQRLVPQRHVFHALATFYF